MQNKIILLIASVMMLLISSSCKDEASLGCPTYTCLFSVLVETGTGSLYDSEYAEALEDVTYITYKGKRYDIQPQRPEEYESVGMPEIKFYGAYYGNDPNYGRTICFGEINLLDCKDLICTFDLSIGNRTYTFSERLDSWRDNVAKPMVTPSEDWIGYYGNQFILYVNPQELLEAIK